MDRPPATIAAGRQRRLCTDRDHVHHKAIDDAHNSYCHRLLLTLMSPPFNDVTSDTRHPILADADAHQSSAMYSLSVND